MNVVLAFQQSKQTAVLHQWASSLLVLLAVLFLLGATPVGVFVCGWGFSAEQLTADPCLHDGPLVETAVVSITSFLTTAYLPATSPTAYLIPLLAYALSQIATLCYSLAHPPLTPPPRP